ncbi:Uncharacterised protein [Shigella sonnei]|nr:Uncharacterised protein [Shigella sonnei]
MANYRLISLALTKQHFTAVQAVGDGDAVLLILIRVGSPRGVQP